MNSIPDRPNAPCCCSPAGAGPGVQAELDIGRRRGAGRRDEVALPGGSFLLGDPFAEGQPADGEGYIHEVELNPFRIDATCVTVAEFARFIDDTGYRTEAEEVGTSAVFHLAVAAEDVDVLGTCGVPCWLAVRGADWRHPYGPRSDIDDLLDHPVVHVSHNDALTYCAWAGRDLPTEAEWEFAARGGHAKRRFPWGDELEQDGFHHANVWQGRFPYENTAEDGYLATAPVRSFPPNDYGLYEVVGNVWEWCADWFDPKYYLVSPRKNPTGPQRGTTRVMRGGSYLCHHSYCTRYRVAARSSNTPDSSTGNLGFRTVSRT